MLSLKATLRTKSVIILTLDTLDIASSTIMMFLLYTF